MITITIISVVLLILFGVLFVPIRIVVNTNKKQYYISLPGYLRADLLFGNGQPFRIKMRIFFVSFLIEPLKRVTKKTEPQIMKKDKPKVKKPLSLFINILKSIQIKYFKANIDTGDFPLNAQLIPVAQMIQSNNAYLNINFENVNNIDLMIQTRGIKLISVYIKHQLFNK